MKSSMVRTIMFVIAIMFVLLMVAAIFAPISNIAYADDSSTTTAEASKDNATGSKAIAAGIAVGLAAAAGAIGMGIAIAKSNDSISRQPEVEGKIRSNMMLGLVFIETAVIYALIVAILVIFVL